MGKALARNALSAILLDRYLSLLAARRPEELLAIIRNNASAEIRNRAVQFAIAGDRPELAYASIRARGTVLPPVWGAAHTALAGQYFDDRGPAIDAAFQAALDTRTIGERLKTPLKPDAVISGSVWFYYGARYGDYLAAGGNANADTWRPASLEAAPGNADAYMALGDSYADAGQGAKAITQFEHAIELDPDRGDAHNRIARVFWSQGRRLDAIVRWKSALATFQRIQSRGVRVPEPFWGRVAATFTDIGQRRAMAELRVDIAQLLADYYRRNREYRFNQILDPAARASLLSGEGTTWLVEMGRTIDNSELILSVLMRIPGLTEAQRISLQRDHVAFMTRRVETAFGDDRAHAETWVARSRLRLVSMLLDAGQVKEATVEWSQLAPKHRSDAERSTELRLASRNGTLNSVLSQYRANPEATPSVETLRNAAMALQGDHDEDDARLILEFLYDREIRAGHLNAANFLGLAEVKLQRNDAAAAAALLKRMALVVDDGFDTLLPAAALLEKYRRTAEATDFLRRRVRATPWDAEARLLLARSLPTTSPEGRQMFSAVAADSQASFRARVQAGGVFLLEGLSGTAGAAYRVETLIEEARLTASLDDSFRRWRAALAIAPGDERVRVGALRTAIATGHYSFAVALAQSSPEVGNQLSIQDRASLAESLAVAAERLDDLNVAQNYLRIAIGLRPADQRDGLVRKLNLITAEQTRRANNAARQPVIGNVIEQSQVVRARIPRSAQ